MTNSAPALDEGWYPDGKGGQRHWDGSTWDGLIVPPPVNHGHRIAAIVIAAVLAVGAGIGWFTWQHARAAHDQDCRVSALQGEFRDDC
jgi:hypothetical protein